MSMALMNNIENSQVLIGCGILKKEINWLIDENNWPLSTCFLDSSFHVNFEKLFTNLTMAIEKNSNQNSLVFYGACHPLMDNILHKAKTIRTQGQNCVEMLLGHEQFNTELSNGAFFLLEDWALHWNDIIVRTYGDNMQITKQIFQEDRKFILGLNTPCSGEFTKEAEFAAQSIGLPLKWMNVGLDNLKSVITSAINKKNNQYYG
jgi:hypothetical protein